MSKLTVENGVLTAYAGSDPKIVIPGDVTAIGPLAFYAATDLTEVTVGDHVTEIGHAAFSDCTKLSKLCIPDSVRAIGTHAFYDCKSLSSITLPRGLTAIGMESFSGCLALKEITIPDSVTEIGQMAFAFCPSLSAVYYMGTEGDWSTIRIAAYNEPLTHATRYYYSEQEPLTDGNYWHAVDGRRVLWSKQA